MNHANLIIAGLVLCLIALPSVADKPAPVPINPVSAQVDKFQSGKSAFDAGKYSKAREIWLPLAESGDPRAQHAIARLYEKGNGVDRDFKVAADWFLKAAEQGHADSEYRLAVGHVYGLGVKRDEATALSWLRKAANHGHKRAQKMLARAYENGRLGLVADPEQAKYWYDKANSGS
jgi:TPR repeat protein